MSGNVWSCSVSMEVEHVDRCSVVESGSSGISEAGVVWS